MIETYARPLGVVLRLGVGICQLWGSEAFLRDLCSRANSHNKVSQVLLTTPANRGLINNIDLVPLVEEIRSYSSSIIGCVKPRL